MTTMWFDAAQVMRMETQSKPLGRAGTLGPLTESVGL